jgi:hypothetical protein
MSEIDDAIAKKLERLTELVGTDKAQKIVNQDIKRKENEGNLVAGAKIGFRNLGLGAEQFIRGLVPGVSEREKNLQNIINENAIKDKQVLSTGYGMAGNIGATVLPALATLPVPGLNTATGLTATGALLGAVQPTTSQDETLGTEDQSRLINTGLGAGGGFVGKIGGDKIAKVLQNRIATSGTRLNKLKLQNQVRDESIKKAQDVGFVFPPSQINKGSTTQKIIESAGGKIQTSQSMSLKNQIKTNELVKKALGIADDQPLTDDAINIVRNNASKVYDDISKLGTMKKDDIFTKNITDSITDYKKIINQLPDRKISKLDSLIKNLEEMDNIDSSNIIVLVKALQKENKALWKAGDDVAKQMQAKVQSSLADDLLNLIGRNIDSMEGVDKSIIETFKNNRVILAKANAVQNAFNSETGDVAAGLLSKNKYLTDELKIIADAYNISPKSFQVVNQSMAVSFADFGLGAGASVITGSPAGFGISLARPLIRRGMESGVYQNIVRPNYKTGNILNKLGLLANKTTPAVSIGAGATEQNNSLRGLLE